MSRSEAIGALRKDLAMVVVGKLGQEVGKVRRSLGRMENYPSSRLVRLLLAEMLGG